MKKTNLVYKFMASLMFILIGCQGDGSPKYPPPKDGTGEISGTDTSSDACLVTPYDILCEETDGKLLLTLCCQYMHPYHIDTCKGEDGFVSLATRVQTPSATGSWPPSMHVTGVDIT